MAKHEKQIYDQLVAEGRCPEKIVYKEGIGYTKEPVCNIKDIKSRMQQPETQETQEMTQQEGGQDTEEHHH